MDVPDPPSSRDSSLSRRNFRTSEVSVQYISSDDESKCYEAEPDPLDLITKLQAIYRNDAEDPESKITSISSCTLLQTDATPIGFSAISNNREGGNHKESDFRLTKECCTSSLNHEHRVDAPECMKTTNHRMISSRGNTISIFNRRLYLPKAHELPVKMGNQALTTFRGQQEVMINSLKDLHSSLKNFPEQDMRVTQPKHLLVQLLHHQLEGLAWLLWRESEMPAGGVMADDMGLGKTLQMISLILKTTEMNIDSSSRFSNVTICTKLMHRPGGGTLVVSPSSVLAHWCSEINRRVKRGVLSVYPYHGLSRNKTISTLTSFDVVLTTYGIVQKEPDTGPLKSITWDRIILDEAHVIRNHKSQTASSIFCLEARKKWVLTGTPVHNKIDDYYALIKFLGLKPFNNLAVWKKFVGNNHESGHQRLIVINKAIMLRRMKEQVKNSDEQCGLRQKVVKSVKVELDPDEFLLYENVSHISKAILAQFIQEQAVKEQDIANKFSGQIKTQNQAAGLEMFKNHADLARWYNNFVSMGEVKTHDILNLLLRLRQLCCHPSLISGVFGKRDFQGGCGSEVSDDDPIQRANRLPLFDMSNEQPASQDHPAVFDKRNPLFKEGRISSKVRAILSCLGRILDDFVRDKVILVSQWPSFLRIIEKFIMKELCMTCISLNGKVPLNKRQEVVDSFNSTSISHRVLLLSLTAGGVGLNLVGGNHIMFVDLHWNPQLEIQASDRIYRFGQMKDVFIYKFICERTIEERILRLQQSKLSLADGIFDSSAHLKHTSNTLTIRDLKLLFGVEDSGNAPIN